MIPYPICGAAIATSVGAEQNLQRGVGSLGPVIAEAYRPDNWIISRFFCNETGLGASYSEGH